MINLDDKKSKGTHWASLFIDRNKLYTLILLDLNILLKKYETKRQINYSQYI